jgi:hypothetical protein
MNSPIFTALTGTPTLRAAFWSPPTAKIQLPSRVRSRIQVATSESPTHQTIDTGRPCTCGSPSGRAVIQPCVAIHLKTGVADLAPRTGAPTSPARPAA